MDIVCATGAILSIFETSAVAVFALPAASVNSKTNDPFCINLNSFEPPLFVITISSLADKVATTS